MLDETTQIILKQSSKTVFQYTWKTLLEDNIQYDYQIKFR